MENTNKTNAKRKISLKQLAFLQAIVIIYSLSGVLSKLAAGEKFLSFKFFVFYAVEIFVLGIYALLWQQVIKKVDLSIAYANRAMAIIWSLIWAVIGFHEAITVKNIIGVIIILIGTVIVNTEHD